MAEIKLDTRPTCNRHHPNKPLWCDLPQGHDGEHKAWYGWDAKSERWNEAAMADDIVTRLRRVTAKPLGLVLDPPPHPLCKEAADEIERLQAKVADMMALMEQDSCEIERLRHLLNEVNALHGTDEYENWCRHCEQMWPCPTVRLLQESRHV